MSFPQSQIPKTIIFVLLLLLTFIIATASSEAEKVERSLVIPHHDVKKANHEYNTGIRCGSCPCVNPCVQQLPPPPPPPPLPPPAKIPYCSPVVMPPPPPRFVYVTSLPEQPYQANIFPSNNWQYFYSSAKRNMVLEFNLLFFSGFLLLQLLVSV